MEYKDWAYKGLTGWPVTKNGFDWLDVAATMLGGLVAAVAYAVDGWTTSSPITGLLDVLPW